MSITQGQQNGFKAAEEIVLSQTPLGAAPAVAASETSAVINVPWARGGYTNGRLACTFAFAANPTGTMTLYAEGMDSDGNFSSIAVPVLDITPAAGDTTVRLEMTWHNGPLPGNYTLRLLAGLTAQSCYLNPSWNGPADHIRFYFINGTNKTATFSALNVAVMG